MSGSDDDEELFAESDGRAAAALFGALDLLDGGTEVPITHSALAHHLSSDAPRSLALGERDIGADSIQQICTALIQGSRSVLELDLERNELCDAGVAALSLACTDGALPLLERLSLASNHVGAPGVEALAAAFSGGALLHLEHINLNDNRIGDDGLTSIGNAAVDNVVALSNLRNLYMDRNSIGDAGLIAFAASLRCVPNLLPKLYELWLSNNSIGDSGMVGLCDALSAGAMCNLGDLRMQYNAIGDAGLHALARTVASNGALRTLWYLGLSDNACTDAGLAAVCACLQAGGLPKLEFVAVTSASVSAAAVESVQVALTSRRRRS